MKVNIKAHMNAPKKSTQETTMNAHMKAVNITVATQTKKHLPKFPTNDRVTLVYQDDDDMKLGLHAERP